MRVFETVPIDGYETVFPVDRRDWDAFRFGGQPRAASWTPIKVYLSKVDEDGRPEVPADFPFLPTGERVLRQRAMDVLGEVLAQYGELLPLDCREAPLWVLNVTRLVDALDEDRSQVSRFDDGRIMAVDKPVFRIEPLRGLYLFKLAQNPMGKMYVTDPFVELVRAAGLVGLDFELVWAPD